MLHYQVSPPKREVKKPSEDSVAPAFLTLGAFAAVPKVHFETVLLGLTKKRTLIVRNPNDTACFLKFLKKPSTAFKLSWGNDGQDILIPPTAQVEITIEWTPKEEGQCFETFQVQGSNQGASRLSVHLLGKCLPPARKQGVKKRPVTVSSSNPSLPKPKDPSLKITGKNLPPPKPPAKVTIPHSPNFSTRFSNRTSSASDRNSIAPNSVSSTPSFKVPVDKTFVSPNPLDRLTSIAFPFTPEPTTKPLTRRQAAGDCADLKEEPEEDIPLHLEGMDPQKTFLLRQEPTDIASPSRRETYLVSPAPNNMGHTISQLACNTTVPQIDTGIIRETDSGVPPLEEVGVKSNGQEASTSGIELDQQVLDSITKALDDELDLKLVHRSVDRILDQVNDIGSEQQRKEIQAKFSRLTEFGDENVLMDPIDFDEEDQLGTKTSSGEFLCMDQMDLVPNFPVEEERKVDSELISSIKQMLKDGKTDDEIIAQYADMEDMVKEIRALYDEMGNKYKSCRECYEICKAAHLSESFTFHRIVIQKAIKNNEIRLKNGVDICSFKSKTSIISSLLSSFNRPWLWSALCLVFHNDKLVADDIDMMNFIDDNLFWNNELMDGFEMGDAGTNTPKEFLEMLVPKFLQNYLEIVYLLDATGIQSVFVPNNSTKKLLHAFQAEYLEEANLEKVLDRIPIKLVDTVDPIQYLIQDNLRGPNLIAWTNIVKLVEELTEGDPDKPRLTYNSSSMESMKESVTLALQEVHKLGIHCELPEEQDFDWLLYGAPSNVDEKLIWQLVLRIRIAQCKKQQGSEE